MIVDDYIVSKIYLIRKRKVMLDTDLAELYGVKTKIFNQAVKRNIKRFPDDFMFQISGEEYVELNRSQIVTGSQKHRNSKYLPYAFTEHGVTMLSSILNSEKAVEMSIFIVRTFIKIREYINNYNDLVNKISEMENVQKEQGNLISTVYSVVKHLIEKPSHSKNKIGFNS